MSELQAAVERVWPGEDARIEVLGGGITNHNVKVEIGGETYVLRVAGKDTNLLGIDRTVELEATKAAAALGIGPEVIDFVQPEGWLVTRFVDGTTPSIESMREPTMLARVAGALRAFHGAPPISGSFDSFASSSSIGTPLGRTVEPSRVPTNGRTGSQRGSRESARVGRPSPATTTS